MKRDKEEKMLDEWQIKKRRRMKYIIEELQKHETVDKNWFKSSISVNYGFHKDTVDDYLTDLEELGIIEIDNGKIHYTGTPKKQRK